MAPRKAKRGKPTPKPLKVAFDVFFYLAAIWAFFDSNLPIPEHTRYMIVKWLVVSGAVLRYTIKYFNLDYKEVHVENDDEQTLGV